jgi:hypothetical protein
MKSQTSGSGTPCRVYFGSEADISCLLYALKRTCRVSAPMSAKCHKWTCTFGVIVEPTLLADFRAKSPRVTLGVTPK